MFDFEDFLIVCACILSASIGFAGLLLLFAAVVNVVKHMSAAIPYMCEFCGHVFVEGENPADRCPICNSD